jgi:hypothetical protein
MTAETHTTITQVLHPDTKPAKDITLVLAWYVHDYKVKAISNTTWYKPGMWLSPDVVQKICDMPGWDVQMVDNDLIQMLTGLAISAVSHSA